MPGGCKRKPAAGHDDDDLWVGPPQCKKSKNNFTTEQNSHSIYENTLNKLRQGSLRYFSSAEVKNEVTTSTTIVQVLKCQNCTNFSNPQVKCHFCEESTCHLQSCTKCRQEFCLKCSIQIYDLTNQDIYSCIGCLRLR